MRIGFMGAGRAAKAFGLYLADKNQEVTGYYSRTSQSALDAAALTQTKAFGTLTQLLETSDCIGILTGDDQLETAAAQLAEALQQPLAQREVKLFFHMSGSRTSEVLYPLKNLGHHCISLHPLQTLNDPILARTLLKQCYFTVEGPSSTLADQLIAVIDGPVMRINPEQKVLYHAAACMASNYLYTLAKEAQRVMVSAGFEPEAGLKALLPLMQGSLESLSYQMPEDALTGPIARGDAKTVAAHLDALKSEAELYQYYKQMGLATLQLASSKKLNNASEIQILGGLLQEEERAYEHEESNR